ncbi:MAG: DUF1799 domain-containing protein [Janthinobacterium lividum]
MGAAEAAAFNLTVEEANGPPVRVWPDNILAVEVFIEMATQWRTGFSGPVGLDYGVLSMVMDVAGVPKKKRNEVFRDLKAMEVAALGVMRAG